MPFADELIGRPTALALRKAVRATGSQVPALTAAADALDPLTLRERSDLLRDALLSDVGGTYDEFAAVVRQARDGAAPFTGWLIWPVTSAVAQRAIEDGSDAAFDDAMALLASLTSRLTSEFAVRPLLRHDIDRAVRTITEDWVTADDPDVRRLASEGTRPYLPWATRVPAVLREPLPTVPILTALYRDDSEYVRRSVANHLNDLSRDHADAVVEVARSWLADPDENTGRLVRHALRTLIKKGHPEALALMGFRPATLEVTGPTLDRTSVAIGDSIGFAASVTNTGPDTARLSIDYTVHHRKANGGSTGKVFKLAVRSLEPGERVDIGREHSFRIITTRKYYPGTHSIEIRINGVSAGQADFQLTI